MHAFAGGRPRQSCFKTCFRAAASSRVWHCARTAAGLCVTTDIGELGCSSDVMPELESACSGQQSCQVLVDETTFSRVNPCPDEPGSYLEVIYKCTAGNILIQRLLEPPRVIVMSHFTSLLVQVALMIQRSAEVEYSPYTSLIIAN